MSKAEIQHVLDSQAVHGLHLLEDRYIFLFCKKVPFELGAAQCLGWGGGPTNNIPGKRGQVSRLLQLIFHILETERDPVGLLGMEALLSLISYLKGVDSSLHDPP